MREQELRFYCFVNFYLSSMQQGIQTGHAAVRIVRKYTKSIPVGFTDAYPPAQRAMVEDWADNHETFITLNGGNNNGIQEATRIISSSDFPWVTFYEDEQSLGGVQTAVGAVLPENIFTAKPERRNGEVVSFEYIEDNMTTVMWPEHRYFELVKLVTGSGLAR